MGVRFLRFDLLPIEERVGGGQKEGEGEMREGGGQLGGDTEEGEGGEGGEAYCNVISPGATGWKGK